MSHPISEALGADNLSSELVWRNVDESKIIPVDPSQPFDKSIFAENDICVTGAALKQFEAQPSWLELAKHTWVYARVSPAQKEFVLHTLRDLGYTTLMAGDGTNDVGALKAAHIGVALLDGSPEDLKAIAEHQKLERMKKVYEQQCKISARFNQPPPPPPPVLRDAYPELVKTQQAVAAGHQSAKKKNPMEKVIVWFAAQNLLIRAVRSSVYHCQVVGARRGSRCTPDQARRCLLRRAVHVETVERICQYASRYSPG